MKMWLITQEEKSALPIHFFVKDVVGVARKGFVAKKYFPESAATNCEKCGAKTVWYKAHDVHHIKPLWVTALEQFLKKRIKNEDDFYVRCSEFHEVTKPVTAACHDKSNMVILCRSCHRRTEIETNAYWVKQLSRRGLVFNDLPEK